MAYQITKLVHSHAVGDFSLHVASIVAADPVHVGRENLHAQFLFGGVIAFAMKALHRIKIVP